MRRTLSTLLLLLTAFQAAPARAQDAAKFVQPSVQAKHQQRPLTNQDVLKMVEAKLATEVVVEKIKSSPCDLRRMSAATSTSCIVRPSGTSVGAGSCDGRRTTSLLSARTTVAGSAFAFCVACHAMPDLSCQHASAT